MQNLVYNLNSFDKLVSLMKNISFRYFILFAAFVLVVAGCRKKEDDFDTSASLQFSTDTILFDTVFTTIGSSTEYFMIYNSSNKAVKYFTHLYLARRSFL